MQKDFHYYAVYVIARSAGFKPSASKTIAYASQHVDDAKYGHELNFQNGGHFQQVLTAHEFISPGAISKRTQFRIFSAFHFLPADGEGLSSTEGELRFRERMLCFEDSEISRSLLDNILSMSDKPYFLHSLGIALHTYADTFSHQGFSGLFRGFADAGKINDANGVAVWNSDTSSFELYSPQANVFSKGLKKFAVNSYLYLLNDRELIKLGHIQVFTLPDEPYRRWKYHHVYLDKDIELKNWELCMKASKNIYEYLRNLIDQGYVEESLISEALPWDAISEPLLRAFKFEGSQKERCRNWVKMIHSGEFLISSEYDQLKPYYDDREWFNEAVSVIPRFFNWYGNLGKYLCKKKIIKEFFKPKWFQTYLWEEDFTTSDWKYFHDAASQHLFFILNDLLSKKGMVCG